MIDERVYSTKKVGETLQTDQRATRKESRNFYVGPSQKQLKVNVRDGVRWIRRGFFPNIAIDR